MWSKVDQILDIARGGQLLYGGDLFDVPKSSIETAVRLACALNESGVDMWGIPGQHDLPNHLFKNLNKCTFGFLTECGYIKGVKGTHDKGKAAIHFFPFGSKLGPNKDKRDKMTHIAICHTLTYQGKSDFGGTKAKSMLRKMDGYDLVLVGDNHQTFIEEYKGRYLVSPGSLMRQDADQLKHRPCVVEWQPGKAPKIIHLDVSDPVKVLTRVHIDKQKERESRLDSFVETVSTKYDVDINFVDNLKSFMSKNKISDSVQQVIWELTE